MAASPPWGGGEALDYAVYYRGVRVGGYRLSAEPLGEGWRFQGRMLSPSLAGLLGFDLGLLSEVGGDLFTRRFVKRIVAPGQGTVELVARVGGEGVVAKRFRNGRLEGRYRYRERRVLDDLSLLYYIRVHPEASRVRFLGLYGLVSGPLERPGAVVVRVPAGRFQVERYRFDRPEAFFEVGVHGPRRLPVRVVFGYGSERLEARLARAPK